MGERAEKSCLDAQYDTLVKLGATESELSSVKNALFFAAKKTYDPEGLFTNTWYEKYSKLITSNQ
jgi:hypothetical protein